MKYEDKYSKSIELAESDLSVKSLDLLNAIMREGELRYRDDLIKIVRMMQDTGVEQISLDALIKIVETVDGNENGRTG